MVYSLENKYKRGPERSSLYKYWNVLLKDTETNRKDVMLVHLWKVGKEECEVCCLVIRCEGILFWKRDPGLLIPHPFLVAAKGKKMTDKKHFSIPAWQERYHPHIEPQSAQTKARPCGGCRMQMCAVRTAPRPVNSQKWSYNTLAWSVSNIQPHSKRWRGKQKKNSLMVINEQSWLTAGLLTWSNVTLTLKLSLQRIIACDP